MQFKLLIFCNFFFCTICYHVKSCFLLDLLFQYESHEFLPLNGNNFYHFCMWKYKAWCGWTPRCPDHLLYFDHQVYTREHVTKIMESEEGMEHDMLDFVVDCFCSEKLSGIHSSFSKDLSQGR